MFVYSFDAFRLKHAGYRISRPPNNIGRYKMVRHKKEKPATNRFDSFISMKFHFIEFRYGTLDKWHRYPYDGFRQLNTLDYSIATIEARPLFTYILVNFTRSATKTIDHLLNDVPI